MIISKSSLKTHHICTFFPQKLHYIKLLSSLGCMYVFLRSFYGCESGTIRRAEHQRIDAFELWCWRRLLRVPWTVRRYNQPILKEIKERKSWTFIGRTDAEAETPVLWPPDVKNWLIYKNPDAGKDWRQEKKGTTEDKMVGWHHWLNGHEFE